MADAEGRVGWSANLFPFLPAKDIASKTGHFGKKLGLGRRNAIGGNACRVAV
jgi:hypothetical protein